MLPCLRKTEVILPLNIVRLAIALIICILGLIEVGSCSHILQLARVLACWPVALGWPAGSGVGCWPFVLLNTKLN